MGKTRRFLMNCIALNTQLFVLSFSVFVFSHAVVPPTMAVRAAGYVIYRKCADIEFLLLQASYGDFHWSPPKGHVDPGENESETALREVQEETGLQKNDLRIVPGFEKILSYKVKNKPKTVVYWMAELLNPNQEVKLSHEHKDFKWLALEEACEVSKYPESIDLLKASHEFLSSSQ